MIINTVTGQILVTDNKTDHILYDEDDHEIDRFPKGIIVFWKSGDKTESEIIPGKLTNDFKNTNEIKNYILESGIIKQNRYEESN